MIRAASIPHLGQTTPTAALGLRAIRSLLTPLDAGRPLTVRVSGIDAVRALKFTTFAIQSETCKKPPRRLGCCLPYICGYDGQKGDISVGVGSPILRCLPPLFDMVVPRPPRIDAIVGDLTCKAKLTRANVRKQA
jgi:hypothetical protein